MFNIAQLFESYAHLIYDQQIAIRLRLGTIPQFQEFLALGHVLRRAAADRGLEVLDSYERIRPVTEFDSDQSAHETVLIWNALSFLASVLQEAYGQPCLVLIDEYDRPFHEAYKSGILNYALDLLSPMLRGVLKVLPPIRSPCFLLRRCRDVMLSSVLLFLVCPASQNLRYPVGLTM